MVLLMRRAKPIRARVTATRHWMHCQSSKTSARWPHYCRASGNASGNGKVASDMNELPILRIRILPVLPLSWRSHPRRLDQGRKVRAVMLRGHAHNAKNQRVRL